MENENLEKIEKLFDDFAKTYQHSLYAIEHERDILNKAHSQFLEKEKKQFEKGCSANATRNSNGLIANIQKVKEAYSLLTDQEQSILKVAEYLSFGSVIPNGLDKILFSDSSLPWIMPFIGHKNLYIESNGDLCQKLGLQFAIEALMQTAPGQLGVTVINPEIRPDFSALSNLPDFKMLIKDSEIHDKLNDLVEEIIQNDSRLKGRFSSLVELRKEANQAVGKLQLLVIQDLPKSINPELKNTLLRIVRGAPRAGIAVIFLSCNASRPEQFNNDLKNTNCFNVFSQSGDSWKNRESGFENLKYVFPMLDGKEISNKIFEIIEESKKTTAITIPFKQIENADELWKESAISRLVFNLGMDGMEKVSVCLGEEATQRHNILISGAAGKGKSNLLEVMIHSLCVRYSPDELELYLLDFKDGLTFKPYASPVSSSWLPHAKMVGLESNRDVGLAVLDDLERERKRRADLFGDSGEGVQNYEAFRKRFPGERLPRIVLIIDEYQKLFDINDEISEMAAALMENLVRQGRACAIHIILASQSITGAAGLLGKDEKIYAQFPVRIALQNTVSESYSIFGMGNDAAANLRVRGEAIINENYGAIDSNRKFNVAFAEPEEMKKLRQLFCRTSSADSLPIVFSKKDFIDFTMILPQVKKWREQAANGSAVRLPCGVRLSVNKDILPISFSNDTGRNIAILGAAEDLKKENTIPGQYNMAVGMLQGFSVSLALQHPLGNARFVMFDGLTPEIRKNSNISRWQILMERFGFPVEVINANDAANWLKQNKADLMAESDEDVYIFGFGMDRCSNFLETDLGFETGASVMQELMKCGTKGVHFICWWSNVNSYKSQMGFDNDGYVGTKILLRMDTDTARDIMGPFVNWSVRDNRAFIHDSSDLDEDVVVMPVMPFTDRVCGSIEAGVW